jgi:kinetochore protein Nuf2
MYSRTLTETCGVRNFVMADLTRPDAARMRHHLSGIMNFAKYRYVTIPTRC